MSDWVLAFMEGLRSRAGPPRGLAERLDALVVRARAAWPSLELDPERWMRFLAQRSSKASPETLGAFAHAEDLYLTFGCAEGSAEAIRLFDSAHLSQLPDHLSPLRRGADFHEEVKQSLRVKLLVATPGKEPGIAAYAGRGPLGAWVRITALHTALKQIRTEERAAGAEEAHADQAPPVSTGRSRDSPEAAVIRADLSAEIQSALEAALSGRPAKERALLKLHFVNGSTIDELGRMFGVHRATAARWIASGRQAVLAETQKQLRERLGLSPNELASALRMSWSGWTLSLVRLLESPAEK
jgi:RNA polymerase sigma-70 factor, ECF subfamily